MKLVNYAVILVAFVLFSACGTRVSTTAQEDVDLGRFHTYAYLPNSSIEVPKENQADEDVNELVIKTINANLQKAGYNINRNNPDLLVLVSTRMDYDATANTTPAYASYPYNAGLTNVSPYYTNYYYSGFADFGGISGYNTDSYSYSEGTVVVDIINRKTKKSVWKGATSQSIYDTTRADAIAQLVNEIFKEYPLIEEKE